MADEVYPDENKEAKTLAVWRILSNIPVICPPSLAFLPNSHICRLKQPFYFRKQPLCFGKLPFYFARLIGLF